MVGGSLLGRPPPSQSTLPRLSPLFGASAATLGFVASWLVDVDVYRLPGRPTRWSGALFIGDHQAPRERS